MHECAVLAVVEAGWLPLFAHFFGLTIICCKRKYFSSVLNILIVIDQQDTER